MSVENKIEINGWIQQAPGIMQRSRIYIQDYLHNVNKCCPTKLSDNEFVCYYREDGIFVFNTIKNDWMRFMDQHDKLSDFQDPDIVTDFDSTRNILYVAELKQATTRIIQYDLDDRRFRQIVLERECTKILVLNDILYLINVPTKPVHIKYDNRVCVYEQREDSFMILDNAHFKELTGAKAKSLFKVDTEEAYVWQLDEFNSISIKRWSQENMNTGMMNRDLLPKSSGICCTDDAHIVFVLGGITRKLRKMKDIWIYDTMKCRTIKSSIETPRAGPCEAILMTESDMNHDECELLIVGFGREQEKKDHEIPSDIHRLISSYINWMQKEWIHIIYDAGYHWKICIDEVVEMNESPILNM